MTLIDRTVSQESKRAFTLLEVVTAITVFAIGVTAIISGLNQMSELHQLRKYRTHAMALAGEILTQVRLQVLTPNSDEKEGEIEGSKFRYKIVFTATQWSGLYSVTVRIFWGSDETPNTLSLYTLQYYG